MELAAFLLIDCMSGVKSFHPLQLTFIVSFDFVVSGIMTGSRVESGIKL